MQAIGAAEMVFELIDRVPEIDHKAGKFQPPELKGKVEFQNVWFSYPTRPDVQVLKGVTFTAQPGEVVALVGELPPFSSSPLLLLLSPLLTSPSFSLLISRSPPLSLLSPFLPIFPHSFSPPPSFSLPTLSLHLHLSSSSLSPFLSHLLPLPPSLTFSPLPSSHARSQWWRQKLLH